MKKLLVIILLLQGCAWSTTDRALFTTFAITHTVDTFQTREILDNDRWEEINPILKDMNSNEATIAMFAGLGLVYLIADLLPQKYRTPFLGGTVAISVWGVANNFSNGVQFKF